MVDIWTVVGGVNWTEFNLSKINKGEFFWKLLL